MTIFYFWHWNFVLQAEGSPNWRHMDLGVVDYPGLCRLWVFWLYYGHVAEVVWFLLDLCQFLFANWIFFSISSLKMSYQFFFFRFLMTSLVMATACLKFEFLGLNTTSGSFWYRYLTRTLFLPSYPSTNDIFFHACLSTSFSSSLYFLASTSQS